MPGLPRTPHGGVRLVGSRNEPRARCSTCAVDRVVVWDTDAVDPDQAKADGQQLSIMHMPEVRVDSFMEVVGKVPAGEVVSANSIRAALDAAGVPDRARAGLFRRAVAAGLIEPMTVSDGLNEVRAVEPSTGGSARRAQVRLYRRVS